jgi:hypothetical protein
MQTCPQWRPQLPQLETLIAKLKKSGDSRSELLTEHLETAYAYLRGAMPKECAHNLEFAQELAESLPSTPLLAEVREAVAAGLGALQSCPPALDPPSASRTAATTAEGLADFLHGAGVRFGIFYPTKHAVSVFPTLEAARAGHYALCDAGFRQSDVLVPGVEVERFLENLRAHRHLQTDLMTELSRLLDTEASLVDRYTRWAHEGSGFLVACCRTEADAEVIAALLKPFDPIAIHWFTAGYIRHLI